MNPEAVLDYWFGQNDPPEEIYRKRWFSGEKDVDNEIRSNFLTLHQQLRSGLPEEWKDNARAVLASIIVLDQFSRNLFRGTATAFSWDPLAVDWAQQGLIDNLFKELTYSQQAFTLLPLIHSESLTLHDQAISHYERLVSAAHQDPILTGFLSSAKEHRAIIKHFGRYPHRNAVLNRASTQTELEYLNSGGRRFGQ